MRIPKLSFAESLDGEREAGGSGVACDRSSFVESLEGGGGEDMPDLSLWRVLGVVHRGDGTYLYVCARGTVY